MATIAQSKKIQPEVSYFICYTEARVRVLRASVVHLYCSVLAVNKYGNTPKYLFSPFPTNCYAVTGSTETLQSHQHTRF